MRVQVIGHSEAVLGFSLAGLNGRAANTVEEANAALDDVLKARDVAIVLVTQEVASLIQPRMEQLKLRSTVPLIVEIPSPGGPRAGEPSLGEVVLRAIGIKL